MWITPILRPQGRFDWTTCPCILHFGCMGIIVTPPGRRNRQAETASQSAQRLRGLACPKHVERTRAGRTFATNMLFPRYPKQPQYPRFPQRLKRPLQSRQLNNRLNRKTHIAGSAGVKPSDKPTEQDRPKRDHPRLVFQPIHAVIAILTLSCALCASLTMLIQQAVHYSALQQSQTPNPNNRRRTEPRKTRRRPRKQHQASSHPRNQTARANQHPDQRSPPIRLTVC